MKPFFKVCAYLIALPLVLAVCLFIALVYPMALASGSIDYTDKLKYYPLTKRFRK